MKNRRKQRRKRRRAALEEQERQEAEGQSLWGRVDGLLGVILVLLFLYWFYSGMIASCASWVSCTPP